MLTITMQTTVLGAFLGLLGSASDLHGPSSHPTISKHRSQRIKINY